MNTAHRITTALVLTGLTAGGAMASPTDRVVLQSLDHRDVKLMPSRWLDQVESARDFYLGVSDDDILHGYREAAGLPAPGKPLGGWAANNSDIIFGQWLSGMARIQRVNDDLAMRNKAAGLITEWSKTLGPDGDCRMGLYAYDKLVCGLLDQHLYADNPDALPLLQRTLTWAMATFPTNRTPAREDLISGKPSEWYTFGENLLRTYQVTHDEAVRRFAESYRYPSYWNKFLASSTPDGAGHVHAYSHVNSFSSLAMNYEVAGDPDDLQILRNAYDYLQASQCFATGGFGPMERLLPMDGTLGRSLEARNASFETVCGSWAGFKMTRYLQRFTGDARYGDWMERLFYNGVGAALPITTGGKHFYYSDYRVTGGMKVYKVSRYSCCSGTYFQCVSDYANIIYYHDDENLYVNLYVPSNVLWASPNGEVTLMQATSYPETETSTLHLTLTEPARFTLKFRVPAWCSRASARVNNENLVVGFSPGTWGAIEREWHMGDVVEVHLPMIVRYAPVDYQHPRRVAVMRGPVVLVMDDWVFEEIPSLPDPADLETWLVPDERPGIYRIAPEGDQNLQARFRPFYMIGDVTPYRMYHDLDASPIPVW